MSDTTIESQRKADAKSRKAAKVERRIAGRAACARGEHAAVQWFHVSRRPLVITSRPMEMMAAAGLIGPSLGKYIGWCPRCWTPLEWASDRRGFGDKS